VAPREWWGRPCSPQFNPSECEFCAGLKHFAEKKREAENASEEAKQKKKDEDEEQIRIARRFVEEVQMNEKISKHHADAAEYDRKHRKSIQKRYGDNHYYHSGCSGSGYDHS
jgi:hypothetical protein